MATKNTAFYRNTAAVTVNFSAEEISTDGAVVLLEKLERKNKLLKEFSKLIPDYRHPLRTVHSKEKLLKQRVFMLMQGYEDTNDVFHLQNDPLFKDILEGDLASQPTLSRFENGIEKQTIFTLCYACIDRYVAGLAGRKEVIIDIDATDDPTHGEQQLSMFNGYYGQFMYNELFFHDGTTGQIILPVLRPGNSHSNRWYVGILSRIVKKIREQYPDIKIIIRADSGFSCPAFYNLAKKHNLLYAIGIASNNVLKKRSERAAKAVKLLYVDKKEKHQHFFSFPYQADSWEAEEMCHCKVESTGIGLNIRYIISNFESENAREIYTEFYVKRGDASENRIKEVKNMCFSDRLSNHGFLANFFRLFLSYLAYEMFRLLKIAIAKTGFKEAKMWQIDTLRTRLLKIGATIKVTKRRIYYCLSKAFVFQDLFKALIFT
jgi:hypothetical protein